MHLPGCTMSMHTRKFISSLIVSLMDDHRTQKTTQQGHTSCTTRTICRSLHLCWTEWYENMVRMRLLESAHFYTQISRGNQYMKIIEADTIHQLRQEGGIEQENTFFIIFILSIWYWVYRPHCVLHTLLSTHILSIFAFGFGDAWGEAKIKEKNADLIWAYLASLSTRWFCVYFCLLYGHFVGGNRMEICIVWTTLSSSVWYRRVSFYSSYIREHAVPLLCLCL